ncbi:MAG: hypothetical protein FWD89_02370 [Firmicutes bacterium]|nr:hypothetical protein [Bacillota bacterium]
MTSRIEREQISSYKRKTAKLKNLSKRFVTLSGQRAEIKKEFQLFTDGEHKGAMQKLQAFRVERAMIAGEIKAMQNRRTAYEEGQTTYAGKSDKRNKQFAGLIETISGQIKEKEADEFAVLEREEKIVSEMADKETAMLAKLNPIQAAIDKVEAEMTSTRRDIEDLETNNFETIKPIKIDNKTAEYNDLFEIDAGNVIRTLATRVVDGRVDESEFTVVKNGVLALTGELAKLKGQYLNARHTGKSAAVLTETKDEYVRKIVAISEV